MPFIETNVAGAFIIESTKHTDFRGAFFRSFDSEEFARRNLTTSWDYFSTATNIRRRTLRGMHYQHEPHGEVKLVRCIRGRVFDVAIDLRPSSPTFRKWAGVELTAENDNCFYIPTGCAHGYLTLEDHSDVTYLIAGKWKPEAAGGVRWNDPAFGIAWPGGVEVILERDANYPDFTG